MRPPLTHDSGRSGEGKDGSLSFGGSRGRIDGGGGRRADRRGGRSPGGGGQSPGGRGRTGGGGRSPGGRGRTGGGGGRGADRGGDRSPGGRERIGGGDRSPGEKAFPSQAWNTGNLSLKKSLVVHSYPADITVDDIKDHFQTYSDVPVPELERKSFSVAYFQDQKTAQAALDNFDKSKFSDDGISVSYTNDPDLSVDRLRTFELPLKVLWDLYSCPYPKEYSEADLLTNFKKAFSASYVNYTCLKVHIFGTTREEPLPPLLSIKATIITPVSRKAVKKGKKRVDLPIDTMEQKMLWHNVKNEPPSPLLLITNRDVFLNTIEKLRKRNFQVLVAYCDTMASEELKAAGNISWQLESLCRGEKGQSSSS